MERWKQTRWPFVAFVLIEVIIFGSGSAVTKFAYESVTPLWCMTLRFGLASVVFLVFFGRRMAKRLRMVSVRLWLPQALCMALSYLFCNVALDLTTATNVGFLVALPVVFAPLLSAVAERARYPRALIPFQVGVAGGLYLLCSQGGSLQIGAGELLALGSSVALAGALVFGKQALAQLDAASVAGTQIVVSFGLCLACALVWEPALNVGTVQPVAWGIIAFLALFSTCLAFYLQSLALDHLSSTTVSLLLTGEPVFTALFANIFLGETLTVIGLVGAAVIVATVVAATYVDGRETAPAQPGVAVALPSEALVAAKPEAFVPARSETLASARSATAAPVPALSPVTMSAGALDGTALREPRFRARPRMFRRKRRMAA